MKILYPDALTPVEKIDKIYLKRDDLYQPFKDINVNGTKLRQCYYLIKQNMKTAQNGVVTGCSIHSPQAPIVASICRHYRIPCEIYYGGTQLNDLSKLPNVRVALKAGAITNLNCKSGRNSVLSHSMKENALKTERFIVKYGIDIMSSNDILFKSVSKQVENIPENIKNLVITCGSAISTIGILEGLQYFNKLNINKIILVGTAPNRLNKIKKYFSGCLRPKNDYINKIKYIDLYNSSGFKYEKQEYQILENITFHPNYEAKTFSWLKNSEYYNEDTCFWVIGNQIKENN